MATKSVYVQQTATGPYLVSAFEGIHLRPATLEEQYRSEQAAEKGGVFEVPVRKPTAVSMFRSRAHAETQRRLGLKVGGTMTEFSVSDGLETMRIEAWGPTPGDRKTAALEAFKAGGFYRGENSQARVKGK